MLAACRRLTEEKGAEIRHNLYLLGRGGGWIDAVVARGPIAASDFLLLPRGASQRRVALCGFHPLELLLQGLTVTFIVGCRPISPCV